MRAVSISFWVIRLVRRRFRLFVLGNEHKVSADMLLCLQLKLSWYKLYIYIYIYIIKLTCIECLRELLTVVLLVVFDGNAVFSYAAVCQ